MLTSPIFKYVASPPAFAYMPLLPAGVSVLMFTVGSGFSLVLNFSTLYALIASLLMCVGSAIWRVKEPHISEMLLFRQKFMKGTPSNIRMKGKFYVS